MITYFEIRDGDFLHQRVKRSAARGADSRKDKDLFRIDLIHESLVGWYLCSGCLLCLGSFIWREKTKRNVLLLITVIGAQVPFRVRHRSQEFNKRVAEGIIKLNSEWFGELFALLPLGLLFLFVVFLIFVIDSVLEGIDYGLDLNICRFILDATKRLAS